MQKHQQTKSSGQNALLRGVPGVELVELPGADQCCGFGGSFSVRLPEVSSAILDKKLASVEATGARCLVACDAGCLMQMGGGLSRRGSSVKAMHLAQVLAGEGLAVSEGLLRDPAAGAGRRRAAGHVPPAGAHDRHHQVHRPAQGVVRRLPAGRGAARPRAGHQGGHPSAPRRAPGAARGQRGAPRRDGALGRHRGGGARDRAAAGARPRGADGGEVQVDGHRGDRPQRGARARGRHPGGDRPGRVHHPARAREAVAHHRPRDPQDQGAGGGALLARAGRRASRPIPRS